jgi:hypothetical protein
MVEPEQKNAVVRWLEGKKTYAVALTILTCGVLSAYGVEIPEYVWAALTAFGLGFLRAGVAKAED